MESSHHGRQFQVSHTEIIVFPLEIQWFLQTHVNGTLGRSGAPGALEAQKYLYFGAFTDNYEKT